MTKLVKIGKDTYKEIPETRIRKRRYSPRRDSSTFFKSPAQKAYESRKNLEHIRNKRAYESHKDEYRKEQSRRRAEAKIRRAEHIKNIKSKAHSLYNKNISLPFRKKKTVHPYGGFESARKE